MELSALSRPLLAPALAALVTMGGMGCSSHDPTPVQAGPQALGAPADSHAAAEQALAQQLGLSIRFSDSVSPQATQLFEESLLGYPRHLFDPTAFQGGFARFFGRASPNAALQFLGQRLHYVFAPEVQVTAVTRGDLPQQVADNPSALLWFAREFAQSHPHPESAPLPSLDRDGLHVEPTSPRVGVIQLGARFSSSMAPLGRLGFLIHEARHSDCPGGVSRSTLERFDTAPNAAVAMQSLQGNSCGHFHVACPAAGPNAGMVNCDRRLWESHTAGFVFLRAMARGCLDCSTEELWQDSLYALDAASRLLALPQSYQQSIQQWIDWLTRNRESTDHATVIRLLAPVLDSIDAYLAVAPRPFDLDRMDFVF